MSTSTMAAAAGPRLICGTCGTDFACLNGNPPVGGDRFGWYDCVHMCPLCFASLRDGRAVMEHPGLGARIHLMCCPVPAEDEVPLFVGLQR